MENSAYNGETLTDNAEGNTVGSREVFSARERSIITGLMLGDGCMERVSNRSARMLIRHEVQQREYVNFLYSELFRFVKTPPKKTSETDKRFDIKTFRYSFKTCSSPDFLSWHIKFYDKNRKKKLPNNIKTLLDDLALAIWFMDDGSFKNDSKGLLINSNYFDVKKQRKLQRVLTEKFKVHTTLHTLGRWKRIYIPAKESPKFAKIIAPHIIPSLKYKLKKISLTL